MRVAFRKEVSRAFQVNASWSKPIKHMETRAFKAKIFEMHSKATKVF